MHARLTQAALIAAVLTVGAIGAGCGDDDGGATTGATGAASQAATGPVASTPDATQPPPQATEPLPPERTSATGPPATTPDGSDEPDDGGATAEEPVRVPATFAAANGRLTPPQITVPPFLAVEVSVGSGDGRAHVVVIGTPQPRRIEVPAGGRASVRLPGLRAGEYDLELDGRAAGTLVAGGEVGP